MGRSKHTKAQNDASALAQPFQKYQRLFWKLLSKLAHQGYVVSPLDGRDLIADFYVDVWSRLVERYDASRGKFLPYLISAFYRFARRRIIQAQSWRGRLMDVEQLAARAGSGSLPEEAAELANVRRVMDELHEPAKSILRRRLQGESERTIHDKLGISRYQVREYLIDAIGKVASALGEVQAKQPIDANVATALWKEGRTIRDTAVLLGVSVPVVREARERNVGRILDSLDQRTSHRGRAMNDNDLALLKKALLSPGNEDVLSQIRESAARIRDALEAYDVDWSEDDVKRLEQEHEWVARVYQAFAEADAVAKDDEDDELTRAIEQMRADKDLEIASAFAMALETLPEDFHQWDRWFGEVPKAPKDYQQYLNKQTVVAKSGEHGAGLITYGMTPSTIAEAARGVELLVDRLVRSAGRPHEQRSNEAKAQLRLARFMHTSASKRIRATCRM